MRLREVIIMASRTTMERKESAVPIQKDPDVLAAAARMAGEDLCSIADLSSAEVRALMKLGHDVKRNPREYRHGLDAKQMVLMFEKASLRTRLAFEAGINTMGGNAIFVDQTNSPLGERETIADVARNLERWVDVIVLRTYAHDTITEMAATHLQSYNGRDIEELILAEALRPWGMLKKFCYRGSVHDVSFKSPLKRVPEFQRILQEVTNKYDYSLADIGVSVIPFERARAVHVAFDLHCNPADAQQTAQVKNLWLELSERLIDEGAFFDRPYGAWSDMVYRRAGTYTQKLKEIKREIDPNHILNPGHLCF